MDVLRSSAVAEKAANLSNRAKEMLEDKGGSSVLNRARTLVSGDAQFFSMQQSTDELKKQLDADSLPKKKEAMKRIVAQISLGTGMAELFPDVVKNIHYPSIELRKLIYHYVLHYCDERPNEALLSISAFQTDLVDKSMHVRALALRTLSSIRIAAIHPVVMIAIKKCATDISPLVRRTAATAIAKAHATAKGDASLEATAPILQNLLGDRSMEVVGAAALTFTQVCPNRWDLLHAHFRRICRALMEADTWGQVVLIQLMTRYARVHFVNPEKKQLPIKLKPSDSNSDYSSSDDDSDKVIGQELDLDADHQLLLQSAKPLLRSLNRAVVAAVTALYYHAAPRSFLEDAAAPLLRLLDGGSEGHMVTLMIIESVISKCPRAFSSAVPYFLLHPDDSPAVRDVKLNMLAKLVNRDNCSLIVSEFRSYLHCFDVEKVAACVKGCGQIAITHPELTPQVTKLMLPLLVHPSDCVVTETVVVLRQLVAQSHDNVQSTAIVRRLVSKTVAGKLTSPVARASVLWLVGENIHKMPDIATFAPDLFRLFVKTFSGEQPLVKGQVLALGAKIWVALCGEGALADRFKQMLNYLLELARFDDSFDVRDQCRLLTASLERSGDAFAVIEASLRVPKPPPVRADPLAQHQAYTLGSTSFATGAVVQSYSDLPEWSSTTLGSALRCPPEDAASSSFSSSESNEPDSDEENSDEGAETDSESTTSGGAGGFYSSDDGGVAHIAPIASPLPKPAVAVIRPAVGQVRVVTRVVQKPTAARVGAGSLSAHRVADELFAKKPQVTQHTDPAITGEASESD